MKCLIHEQQMDLSQHKLSYLRLRTQVIFSVKSMSVYLFVLGCRHEVRGLFHPCSYYINGPADEILVLISSASNKDSDEPARMRSLV